MYRISVERNLTLLWYLWNVIIIIAESSPPDEGLHSLAYGASRGKGQIYHPVKSFQTEVEASNKKSGLEIESTPVIKGSTTTTFVAPTPSKHHEPLCIDPNTLGIPTVQSCSDLKIMGIAASSVVVLQEGLQSCELMNDLSCDNGSGDGMRRYQARLSKSGRVAMSTIPGVGPCVAVERTVDGRYEVKISLNWHSSILCCRVVCVATTTTTTQPPTTQASFLPDTAYTMPRTTSFTTPQVQSTTRTALLPLITYTTPSPSPPTTQIASASPSTVPLVSNLPEMCVMPKYLDLPRVNSCEDLRDIALSTNYVQLINIRAADCLWLDDPTCAPTYPRLGAYLDGGIPDGACLALRQTECGNVIGPYPILSKYLKEICRNRFSHSTASKGAQMMPVMMMPIPAHHGKGGRRLQTNAQSFAQPHQSNGTLGIRRLHGKHSAPPSKGWGSSAGDSVVICCRLQCDGSRSRTSLTIGTYANVENGGNLLQLVKNTSTETGTGSSVHESQQARTEPKQNVGQGAPDAISLADEAQSANSRNTRSGDSRNTRSAEKDSDLCKLRYSFVCTLATPLRGEQIVFDQRCLSEDLPGCYAGGMPCCRSVSLLSY